MTANELVSAVTPKRVRPMTAKKTPAQKTTAETAAIAGQLAASLSAQHGRSFVVVPREVTGFRKAGREVFGVVQDIMLGSIGIASVGLTGFVTQGVSESQMPGVIAWVDAQAVAL